MSNVQHVIGFKLFSFVFLEQNKHVTKCSSETIQPARIMTKVSSLVWDKTPFMVVLNQRDSGQSQREWAAFMC